MFAVFSLAAADPSKSVASPGFEIVQRVVTQHSGLIQEHQPECAACLCAFLQQPHHESVALLAAQCLSDYAQVLHGGGAYSTSDAPSSTADVSLAAAAAEMYFVQEAGRRVVMGRCSADYGTDPNTVTSFRAEVQGILMGMLLVQGMLEDIDSEMNSEMQLVVGLKNIKHHLAGQ